MAGHPCLHAGNRALRRISTNVALTGSYVSLGGIWAGTDYTTIPNNPRWEPDIETVEPGEDVGPRPAGWTQALNLGEPRTLMRWRRLASVATTTPAAGDELASWLALDQQMRTARHFLWYLNQGDTSQVWVMRRRRGVTYTLGPALAEGPWELEEVVGP